jgi:hypothetical protein
MSHKCAVCRRPDAKPLTTIRGSHLGWACAEICTGLLWQSHFVRATGGSPYDHALVLWEWKARAADVNGVPFKEPPPESPAEKVLTAWANSMGVA